MTIKYDELVDNFAAFDDWEDKYAYLIDLGGGLPPMDASLKTAATKVQGCMSEVWMVLRRDAEGRVRILADSDARIVQGLIAILMAVYDGKTDAELADVDASRVFAALGLDRHLSPNRRNGFFAMLEKITAFTSRHT